MSVIGADFVIFTTPDPALIGPSVDKIVVREGVFTTATVTSLSATNLVATAVSSDVITPTVPGTGVTIDNVLIRDSPHYAVANRSVASLEGINPASSAVSIALKPLGTGAIIGAVPDGTALGGNTRGNSTVDLQLVRSVSTQVGSGNFAVIVGGSENTSSALGAIVTGGSQNTVGGPLLADYSIVIGGVQNIVSATTANAQYSIIGGGAQNSITDSTYSVINGGNLNVIAATNAAVIGGGNGNNIYGGGADNIISGGSNNTIQAVAGTGFNCVISGGSGNVIVQSNLSAISSGFGNTVTGCVYSNICGGTNNIINGSPYSFIAGGNANSISGGQQSAALGWGCDVVGTFCVGVGLQARPVATGSHVFASYSAYGGANSAYTQYSGNFVYDTINSYVFTKEVHNNNTEIYYGQLNTVGPVPAPGTPILYVFPDQFSSQHWDVMISGAGGNNGTAAAGYGHVRMYKKNDGTMTGTGVFNGSATEDGGFGFGFNMGYSGGYAFLRITCGVGAGVKCNWTIRVIVQKSSRLFAV